MVARGLHGYGRQPGNFRARYSWIGSTTSGTFLSVEPQESIAQPGLLRDQIAEALHVHALGRGIDQTLKSDVL